MILTKRSVVWCGLLLSVLARAAGASSTDCCLYDPDPQHLWNRLHETLFIRVGPDGQRYGLDRLDPLFWSNTKHLLTADSHQQALRVLDEFMEKRGEKLIPDALPRAFLQHDLWALFDWSARYAEGDQYARERRELQVRLATLIRRLALTQAEIASLPDNYAHAQARRTAASLPRGLVSGNADWVNVSTGLNTGLAIAPRHLAAFGGRSVFHVWLRLPGGRRATVAYLKALRSFEHPWVQVDASQRYDEPLSMNPALPQFPTGTQWALLRRMCVVDAEGRIQPTSIVESIQVRHYVRESEQQVFKFMASRRQGGVLREIVHGERDFTQFESHGTDPFESTSVFRASQADILRSCHNCHFAPGIQSVQSYARISGNARRLRPPALIESDEDRESPVTLGWKQQRYEYGLLQGLWLTRP